MSRSEPECPSCVAAIKVAHQQIYDNPRAVDHVDELMSVDHEMPLSIVILKARDHYHNGLFKSLEDWKATHGSLPCFLKYHLAIGMTDAQRKRLEAL